MSRRALAALAAAALLAACGGDEGPAAPGGRNGVLLRYVTPRLQVLPEGAAAEVEIALEVRRETTPPESEPWAGAPLRIVRDAGAGLPSETRVVTDEAGIARFQVAMPSGADKTALIVSLEADSDSYLPFDVVTAPVLEVDLAAGGILHLDPPRDGVLLRFVAPATHEARWTLVPYSTDTDRGGVPYRYFHQPNAAGAGAASFGARAFVEPFAAPTPAQALAEGDVMSGAEIDPGPLRPSAAVPQQVSIQSCAVSTNRMAPLRYLSEHVAIYVDDDPALYQARIDSLGEAFDQHILPTDTEVFGPPTDLDGNGVVFVILTPALAGGAYCDSVRRVRLEALYATWSPTVRIEALMSLMAHELQHVIHSGIRIQRLDDDLWVNEGMSLAAEAINGYWYAALPRTWQFLNGQNTGLSMLSLTYSRSFDEKYMMFFLYLYDRFGDDFFRRLASGPRSGEANLEAVTGLSFDSLLRDWFVASGAGGDVDDPDYAFRTIQLHGMEAEIAECRCLPVTAFDGMRLDLLALGGGFDAFRTLAAADADYYELVAPAGLPDGARDVYYDAYGRTAVKLSVVRTR